MSGHEDQFPAVAAAVRAGVNDAYRLGVGAAIAVLIEYRTRTTDPLTLDAAISHLQHLSLTIGSEVTR